MSEWSWGKTENVVLHVRIFAIHKHVHTLFVLSPCRNLCATIAMEKARLDWYSHGDECRLSTHKLGRYGNMLPQSKLYKKPQSRATTIGLIGGG